MGLLFKFQITPGSATDVDGHINVGEELLSINGVIIIGRKRFGNETITALLNTRFDGVELIVAPTHEVSFFHVCCETQSSD